VKTMADTMNRATRSTIGITVTQQGSVNVLTLDGELTGPNVRQFRGDVERLFAADARDFVVDFARVTGLDSEGLEALTWLRRECDNRLGMVKLCNLSDVLSKILEMTRLKSQFEQHAGVDEAVGSFL